MEVILTSAEARKKHLFLYTIISVKAAVSIGDGSTFRNWPGPARTGLVVLL